MLWLYILLAVLLLILLLLLLPVGVEAQSKETTSVSLTIGFVKIRLYPAKEKKKKRKTKKEDEKAEKPKEKKPGVVKEKGVSWLVDYIKRAAALASGVLKDFFGHIIVKRLMISIRVAGNDAADTAVKFGKYCAAVYPAVSTVTRTVRCKSYGVDINPDFDEKVESGFELDLSAHIRVVFILGLLIRHGRKGLELFAELKQ